MATSKGANLYNRQNWEQSDFPILCQTCLGDNPYVRMLKDKFGKECKICVRPFTIFKWCPGAKMRYKKTEICQTCAKLKNVCQTCLLDLEYGLPIEVRDKALAIADTLPRSDVNKEFFSSDIRERANTDGTVAAGTLGKSQAASDLLMKLARTTPYYKRNRPHICSFWVKGECKRGEECPYRHEMPNAPDDPLSNQNIKDRFYGVNDPVAAKMLKRAESMPKLESPSDKSITTLYVGGLDERIKEDDLRNFFYQYGEIRSVVVASNKSCGFICYTSRQAAEMAAERSFNKVIIKGKRLKVLWGRSQEQRSGGKDEKGDRLKEYPPVPGLPDALPPIPTEDAPIMEPPNLFDELPSEQNASNIPLPAAYSNAPPMFSPHMSSSHPQGIPPPPPNMGGGFPPGPPPFMQRFPPPSGSYSNQVQPSGIRFSISNGPSMRHGLHYPSQDPHRMGTEGSIENTSVQTPVIKSVQE